MSQVKILVLRFSSMGDIVLTTPVFRCLKQQLKDVEVHLATKAKFAHLLRGNPYIDKIHTLDNSTHQLIEDLHDENFDLIIDLHNNIRTSRIKLALGIKTRTVNKLNFRKWLLVRFKVNIMPEIHIVQRYLNTVASLGVNYDEKGLDFFVDEETERNEDHLKWLNGREYVVFASGGTYVTKRLPISKMHELFEKTPFPLVVIGGPEDFNDVEKAAVGTDSPVLNLCGMLSVMESAMWMKHSNAVVSHDTGMMHIAAALGKKTISVWGNTVPDFGMWPLFPDTLQHSLDHRIEVKALPCRPCHKLGSETCPKGHFDCMNKQNIDEICEILRDN